MSDGNFSIAPVINFNAVLPNGGNLLAALNLRRTRLNQAIIEIEGTRRDIMNFSAEGQRYASYAVAAASVLMVTDIVSIGYQAVPGPIGTGSRFLFKKWAQAESQVRDLLKIFGIKTTTRSDILGSVDESLSSKVLEIDAVVRDSRSFLAKIKVNPPKELALILDIGSRMSQDTALMINAAKLGERVALQGQSAQLRVNLQVARLNTLLRQVDQEILKIIEEAMRRARTA